ncbi:hypothetical protein Ade02nite_58470 [Paractinoplanes deccanensis]|uniref:Uncharacterized protein n=1 Tax=Paractinoplanes deccanensis TaxID=113561 RepID=A0ABQ3YB69_9ACTN|nr:hypothetical protein Ade02nite_58470 [Actinoplanes deccanensis]
MPFGLGNSQVPHIGGTSSGNSFLSASAARRKSREGAFIMPINNILPKKKDELPRPPAQPKKKAKKAKKFDPRADWK